jgi:site-specific DNA recombinase
MSQRTRRLTAVPDSPQRAGLYVRVSAVMGRSDDTFMSPELQLRAMRGAIGQRGILETASWEDIDQTGRDFDRAGIQAALAAIRAGEIDALVVYDVSRLGRNTRETLETIEAVRAAGAVFISVSESIDDTPEGQLALTLFLGMAQHYSDVVGRRWRQVITYRAEQGRYHGGQPPLGYRRQGRDIVLDEQMASLVADTFERYAAGELMAHLARRFSAARGQPTAKQTLKRMLSQTMYVGRITVQGREWPSIYPTIVDEQTWARVQRRLERDRRTPSRHLNPTHPLVGVVVCHHCGHVLSHHMDLRRGRAGRLECRRAKELHECCGVGMPRVDQVVDVVLAGLRQFAAQLRADPAARAGKQARRARAASQAAGLRRELVKVEDAIGRLAVDYARRDISELAHRKAVEQLELSRRLLLEQIDQAQAVGASPPSAAAARQASDLAAMWPELTVAEQNAAVRLLVGQVRVRRAERYRQPLGERVEVSWL